MIEVSNSDAARILDGLDIAIAHYSSLRGLRNANNARMASLLKEKLNRKLNKQLKNNSQNPSKPNQQ